MDAVADHLAAARLVAATKRPYYASALFALEPCRFDDGRPASVDIRGRLVHSDHVLHEAVLVTATRIVHGLEHLLRDHAERGATWTRRIGDDEWAQACDLEINDDLDGLVLPDGFALPSLLGLDDGLLAEAYAQLLERRQDAEPCPGQPEPGPAEAIASDDLPPAPEGADAESTPPESPGCSCPAATGEDIAPDEPGLSTVRIEQLRDETARAVGLHAGTLPGNIERWATDRRRPPVVDWRRVLARHLRRAKRRTTGASDFDSRRPSRRSPYPVLLPRLRDVRVHPAIVLDTSGSIEPDHLRIALDEIDGVLRSVDHADAVRVYAVDTEVQSVSSVRRASDIDIAGGGGSDMAPGIDAAIGAGAEVVIVLTDGWVDWPEHAPRTPVIAALVGHHTGSTVPDWIQTVTIGDER